MLWGIRIALVAAAALAAGQASADENGRYRIEKSGDGYIRMDTATGQMSYCRPQNGEIVCRMSAEERAAFDELVSDMETRMGELERRLAALEGGGAARPDAEMPSDEDVEKALGFMEKFFRRFKDIVKDFEKDLGREEPAEPAPDRT